MLIVVPRILQRRWGRASRSVREIGVYQQSSVPFACSNRPLPVPIVLLYIAPHVRCLPAPYSLDKPASSNLAPWHQREAEAMRGLSSGGVLL